MPSYLVCNTTSYNHTDYNKPISVHKSTDYRTSSGTNHRFIAPYPQDFDARVKTTTKSVQNPVFKDDFYVSDYGKNYLAKKSVKDPLDLQVPTNFWKVHYFRDIQEKLTQDPPRPIATKKSVTQEDYDRKFAKYESRSVFPPNPYKYCELRNYGKDEQPPLRPEENGFMKNCDIYFTTSRASFVPYDQIKQNGIAKKDIITFYDGSGVPRGSKGYGPKNDIHIGPFNARREPPILRKKKLPLHSETIPHRSYLSEAKEEFCNQTYSVFHPYLFENGVDYKAVLADATAWQTMAAPGMYCTESCHLGTGWPVRSVIELKKPKKLITHNIPPFEYRCTLN
ncbi:PREDICTED: uncharacterized protein LOC108557912 [Nicrophorus vespilloides]|uniref:Uncharacterized protein LOC108557912 n=1 Tax=Nicrophorus vespilloides TaxID=110193 RepID=A0ABM1M6B4_NICVS|nr:PREDICTED: uncharacterized protein LOC108557912 [Nicrophorus vespilloides]